MNPLPDVILKDDLRALAIFCPMCGMKAVVPLTKKQLAEQPDRTTMVCHPALSGCNQGFCLTINCD